MKFNILTIFPDIITTYTSESILGRAQENKYIEVNPVNIRDYTDDKHNKVDDTPYGGGAGMVMQVQPIYDALKSIDAIPFSKVDGLTKVKKIFNGSIAKKKRTILMSPRGRVFDQRLAESWSHLDELTIICGRYEGIDQRVTDHLIDEEISVGSYVLAGGELASLIILEAVSRLIPGVLGNNDSLAEETFGIDKKSKKKLKIEDSKLQIDSEYAQYTKPADFKGWKVPDVLLSGDHKRIEKWRGEWSENK